MLPDFTRARSFVPVQKAFMFMRGKAVRATTARRSRPARRIGFIVNSTPCAPNQLRATDFACVSARQDFV
jgi:hypothetical protein